MARGPNAPAKESVLGRRLRELRETEYRRLTQEEVAQALGQPESLSVATISMWEGSGRIPPTARLSVYARLFCTPRSFAGQNPHLLEVDDLTVDERARMQALERELLSLRETALADAGQEDWSIWSFPDGRPITLVCTELPEKARPEYANPGHRDYVRAYSWADVDALIELHGHIRAENPTSSVQIKGGTERDLSYMQGHVVLIGGVAWNKATSFFSAQLDLPVRQLASKDHIFVAEDGEAHEFGPVWGDDEPGATQAPAELRVPVEDVGLFVRTANPQAPQCTLSICNGVTTRGVLGAVLAFTAPTLRERNERHVASRFGRGATFCMLMRVPIFNSDPVIPDLTDESTVLYEWRDEGVQSSKS
jgi:transcriptional regulator with XRE-family HTH domain